MKQRALLFLLVFMGTYATTSGQSSPLGPVSPGWNRIYIKDVGSFDLPPTLEIQDGNFRTLMIEGNKKLGLDASQVTAQPKGLNDFAQQGLQKYARVILRTSQSSPGDFEKLNFKPSSYSASEITEISTMYKNTMTNQLGRMQMKLLYWHPLKIEIINGMTCLHTSYRRQLKDQPIVQVDTYIFHNYDRMHMLTLSYRVSESSQWKSDFSKILASFRITNVR